MTPPENRMEALLKAEKEQKSSRSIGSLKDFFVGLKRGSVNPKAQEETSSSSSGDNISPIQTPLSSGRFSHQGGSGRFSTASGASGGSSSPGLDLDGSSIGYTALEDKYLNHEKTTTKKERSENTRPSFAKFDVLNNSMRASGGDVGLPMGLPRRRSKEDLAIGSTKISRVENSWYLISGKIGEVGLRFFLEMFKENPELVELFPFGDDSVSVTGLLRVNDRTKAHVRAHAIAVMRVVGTCVAGLTKIEDLIPRLRSVGATHKTVGVQPHHYDILYKHLVKAIRDEVGPDNWDQETEDAWEQAFLSISDMIKRPSKRLETEPLRGWGVIMLVACTYFMIVTPFRFAGFLYGHDNMVVLLNILDSLAAFVMAIDMVVNVVQTKLRVGHITNILDREKELESQSLQEKFRQDFPNETTIPSDAILERFYQSDTTLKRRRRKSFKQKLLFYYYRKRVVLYRKLQALKMDRWVPWPALDARVLISFALQWMYIPTSICAQIGLHWTQLFGLIRVLCATRVWHFMQCAENNALIEQRLDGARQVQIRVIRLLLVLAFIIHIAACTWCTVARLELGVTADEFQPSPFFPSDKLLYGGESKVFRSYSRAVHWAFVNLSGIGDVDSSPETALECWTTLIIHVIGAVFYAIVTGNVIAILEEKTQHENKMGSDIIKLSSYLETARVSEFSKDRIMKGYMMRNVLTQGSETTSMNGMSNGPDLNDEILSTLPGYLRQEVGIYARAELIHRKDKFFSHCSKGFLVALSSSLNNTRTLLTGDYLMKESQYYRDQFVLIESGTLQIQQENHTIKVLGRGDCIGKAWLLQLRRESKKNREICEKTDYVRYDGRAMVTIRALSPCTLLTGLFDVRSIKNLERGYKVDFQLLQGEVRGTSRSESESKAIARKVLARAARRYIQRKRNKQHNQTQWRKAYYATHFVQETHKRAIDHHNHHDANGQANDDDKKEPNCFTLGCVLM